MAKLKCIQQRNTISFASKFRLHKSLAISILLYGCETSTLLADWKTRIPAFETKYPRKGFRMSYLEHKTNECVRSKITFHLSPQEPLLATVAT